MPQSPSLYRRRSQPAPPLESLERRLLLCDIGPLTTVTSERSQFLPTDGPAAYAAAAEVAGNTPGVAGNTGAGPGFPIPPSPRWTSGLKRILYVRVTFADRPDQRPQTLGSARRSMAFADAFFRANSYGQTSFKTTFTDTVVLPHAMSNYGTGDWQRLRTDALAAVKALRPEWDPARFDLDVVRYDDGPAAEQGRASGFALTGERGTWLRGDAPSLAVHELGHNLGLNHAGLWEPADPDAPAGPGRHVEYGNTFDVMGGGAEAGLAGHFNAYEKNFLGWLPDSAVESVTTSGTYTVLPADAPEGPEAGQHYALKVRKDDQREYWLSPRGDPHWATNPSLSGLEVDWGAWSKDDVNNSHLGSDLLDMTPQTPAGLFDYGLPLGRTFTDESAGLHLTPVRRDASGAVVVRIEFDADQEAPDLNAPAPPQIEVHGASPGAGDDADVFPRPLFTARAGQPFTVTASSGDADGDDLAYAWDFGPGAAGGAIGPGGAVASGAPGAIVATPAATVRYDAPGVYRLLVTVSDLRGRTATSTVIVEVTGDGALSTNNVVTGRVSDVLGNPMEHVRVAAAGRWTYSDTDGSYVLSGLPAEALAVSASRPGGWSFQATNFVNRLEPGPVTRGVDFRGTPVGYHITGAVTTPNSFGVPDVVVSDGTQSALTDGLGRYSLPALNGTHTLTFTRAGYPIPDATAVVNEGDATANVRADVQGIVGFVQNVPSAVRTITISNGQISVEAILDHGQAYYALGDAPQGSWALTATGRGGDGKLYNFAPSGWSNPLTVDGAEQGVNFVYAPNLYLVTGRARAGTGADADPILDATVTAANARSGALIASAMVDDAGRYALLVPRADYIFAARRPGTLIFPFQIPVAVTSNNGGVNFKSFALCDPPPTVVRPAAAETEIVTGVSTWLSTYAADDRDGDRLVYTWRMVLGPAGGVISFSRNGDNAAQRTLATFNRAGVYAIEGVAEDSAGGRAVSLAKVTVVPVLSAVRVGPRYRVLPAGAGQTFDAVAVDQFGLPVQDAPPMTWRVVGPVGSIAQDGSFIAERQPPAASVRGAVVARLSLPSGGELSGSATVDVKPAAAVVGRHVFYNNSAYDGYSGAALPGDDRAIAPDKQALLPGDGRATAANYTGYARGINGVMIDLDGAWSDSIDASDVELAVGYGYGASEAGWSVAPAPRQVATRKVSVQGKTLLRVTLVWDEGVILNQWLRVTVLPTDRTGLPARDVFYFGNLAGDTADAAAGASTARVSAPDVERTLRRNLSVAELTSLFDHDRDGVVSEADALAARRNLSAWIDLITP